MILKTLMNDFVPHNKNNITIQRQTCRKIQVCRINRHIIKLIRLFLCFKLKISFGWSGLNDFGWTTIRKFLEILNI